MVTKREVVQKNIEVSLFFGTLTAIALTSLVNFLLFHTIAELISIIITGGIFVVGWNARYYQQGSFFLILAASSLVTGVLDTVHTLAYEGMNLLVGFDANLPTQLWIAARYLQAGSLLLGLLLSKRELPATPVLLTYFGVGGLAILAILVWQVFPTCYVPGHGLTPFKIASEYVIDGILLASLVVLVRKRAEFDALVWKLLLAGIACTMASELAFIFYVGVYDFSNLVGHLFKIAAFYLSYKAVIVTGLKRPFDVLFHKLSASEQALQQKTQDLSKTNQKLEIIVEDMPGGIAILEPRGRVTFANSLFRQMYETGEGRPLPAVLPVRVSAQPGLILGAIQELATQAAPGRILVEASPETWLQVNTELPRIPGEENPFAIVIQVQDMSSLVKFDQVRKRFVSNVSHELRTPITAIDLSIKNLEKYGKDLSGHQQQQLVRMMSESASVLARMVEDLLVLSRIDAQRLHLHPEWHALEPLVSRVRRQLKPLFKEKAQTLVVDVDPAVQVECDAARMEQVFRILLDNAIKFSPRETTITVQGEPIPGPPSRTTLPDQPASADPNASTTGPDRLASAGQSPPGIEGVRIHVRDEGVGIPEKDSARLFERFYRGERETDTLGTGLGLPIAKELVELHGGEISVKSRVGRGTTFTITLPRVKLLS